VSDQFKALIINQEGDNFTREVKSIDKSFLKHGDVTVKVEYSGLNYKDALILKNGARLVKEFPHIPGIDFSGTVEESSNEKFKPGDEVILTGWRVGEIYFGGYSQYAKVNGDFLVKKPKNLSLKQAMIMGTAGFTALQSSFTTKTTREELLLGEKVVEVLHSIYDPEIPVDIYELGLIYDVRVSEEGSIEIDMTLTSPSCPVAETMPEEVKQKVSSLDEVKDVEVIMVFEPTWTKDMMSEEAKLELGFL